MRSIDSRKERLPVPTRSTGKAAVVRTIAARELREHIRSARLMLILATTLALVVISTLAGIFNYRVQTEQYPRAPACALDDS
jgi:hypothetical protein